MTSSKATAQTAREADGQCSCGKPEYQSPGEHQLTLHGLDDSTYDINKIEEY